MKSIFVLTICGMLAYLNSPVIAENINLAPQNDILTIQDKKLSVTFSRSTSDITIYTLSTNNTQSNIVLSKKQKRLAITEISTATKSENAINVTVTYDNNIKVLYTLKRDTGYIGVTPSSPLSISISMHAPAIVIPDDLTYDTVFPASKYNGEINLPIDTQYLLGLNGGENSIIPILWSEKIEKITARSREGCFSSITIKTVANNQIFTGILSQKYIWHQCSRKLNNMTPIIVDWKRPFNARWVAAMPIEQQALIRNIPRWDSWNIGDFEQGPKSVGRFGVHIWKKPNNFVAWSAGFSNYQYPALWMNEKLWLKHTNFRAHTVKYDDKIPVFIYPLYNFTNTPKDILLPRTAIESFYGPQAVKPIKKGAHKKSKYPATCGITEKIEKIYYKSEQKSQKKKIQRMIQLMDLFVLTGYERIHEYLALTKELQLWLNQECKTHPEIKSDIEPFIKNLEEITQYYEKHKEPIQTPQKEAEISRQLITLIDEDIDDEQKEERSKILGRKIRRIGGAQDNVLGNISTRIRCLRQIACMKMTETENPHSIRILQDFRSKTHKTLNNVFGMEGR